MIKTKLITHKQYYQIVILMPLIIIFFNFLVDPFNILGMPKIYGINEKKITENYTRLTKTYKIKTYSDYDTLFVGSSAINRSINPDSYKKIMNNSSKTYNLGVPGLKINEATILIKSALKFNPNIKIIALGIDDFSFDESDLSYMPSKKTLNSKYLTLEDFFKATVSFDSLKQSFFTLKYNLNPNNPVILRDNGLSIKKLNNTDNFYEIGEGITKIRYSTEQMKKLKELKQICDVKNIKLIVFINPIHVNKLAILNKFGLIENFNNMKKDIAKITPFYDFSGINFVTANEENFFDLTHYKEDIGNLIIRRILKNDTIDDFGIFIDKNNVNKCLENQHINYLKWLDFNNETIKNIKLIKDLK